MAIINGTSSKNNYKFYAEVTETLPSNYVSTNKTVINYKVYIQNQNIRFNSNNWTKQVNIDNAEHYKKTGQNINTTTVGYTSSLLIMSGSKEIEHNADGSKKIKFEAFIEKSSYGAYDPGRCYLSENVTLTTIPRASIPTAGTQTIGQTLTINTNRKSASFTHNLYYSFGGIGQTLIASGVGDNYPWALPNDLYAQIPNSKSGTGTIYCETYNGGTKIGDTKTCTFTALVNENTSRPVVTLTVTDTNAKTVALTNNSNKLVKYYSTAKITAKTTVKNYASMGTVYVNANGSITNSNLTTYERTITNVDGNNFIASAADSRGIASISVSATPDMVNYVILTCNDTLYRPQQTGGELKLKVTGNFFNGSFGKSTNTLTLKYRYREKGASSYGAYKSITPTISNNTYYADVSMGTNFDYQKSYEVEVLATDLLDSKTAASSISQGIPVLWIGEDSIESFGKTIIKEKLFNIDLIYPVGSIYMSVNATNPSQLFGGTWELWGGGRVPIGVDTSQTEFNTVEKTGGTKNETLNIYQIPSHNHGSKSLTGTVAGIWLGDFRGETSGIASFREKSLARYQNIAAETNAWGYLDINATHEHAYNGGGQAHNNLQPYITCYMWKRTA